ncbi:MAG TPA: TolC family protein [Stellaceae bacterium]|nr:TolC family protein [Stellaceae bacterium]
MAAASVALLYGCAGYQPKPLSPADNARRLDSRTLADPRLRHFVRATLDPQAAPAPAPGWNLTTLTLAALYFHPDIRIAQAKLAGAEAAVITARERPNPVLNLTNIVSTAAVAGAISPGAAPVTVGPVIDLVLETAGKRAARTARAKHLAAAARWDIATAEWQVRAGVRDALLDLWAAQRGVALLRRQLALQDQLVLLLDHRFAQGAASGLDVSRERIDRARVTLALGDLDRKAAEARVALATAIGIPARGLDGIAPNLAGFDHPPAIAATAELQAWRRRALTGRSDVQASLADYDATQSALRLAVAGQYPNITLGPGYNYDLGVNRYILNLGGTLPVFHQNRGPIAEALAQRGAAAAAFTALQARIIGAIDAAETAYRKASESLAATDALLADETRRAQRVDAAFRAGQVDRPTLVAAQLAVATTALSRLDAVVGERRALGALEDALQRPLFEPGAALPPPSELSS